MTTPVRVNAEQHALDAPGHWLTVKFVSMSGRLIAQCQSCDWWTEQKFPHLKEEPREG
jgi:hypothetical protein